MWKTGGTGDIARVRGPAGIQPSHTVFPGEFAPGNGPFPGLQSVATWTRRVNSSRIIEYVVNVN